MPISAQEIWKNIILGIANAKKTSSTDAPLDCEVALEGDRLQVTVDADNRDVLSSFAEAMRLSDPDVVQSILGWDFNSIKSDSEQGIRPIDLEYIKAVDGLSPTELFEKIRSSFYIVDDASVGLLLSEDESVLKITVDNSSNNFASGSRVKFFRCMITNMQLWLSMIKRDELSKLLYSKVPYEIPLEPSQPASDDKWGHYIQAIFSYDEINNEAVFDAGLLKSLLVPQPISITDVPDEDGQRLTIDLKLERLYTWLSQSKDWLLVPVLGNEENSRLVLWAKLKGHTVARDRRLFLVLDRSSSMDGYMEDLNSLAKKMQEKFLEKAPYANNDVSVLHFNDRCIEKLSEGISQPEDCSMQAMGGTCFEVVLTSLCGRLQDYHREKPEGTSYVIMLTDGCDNGDYKDYGAILQSMKLVEGASYVIGLGKDVNDILCRNVAQATGGDYSQVANLDMGQFSAFDIAKTRSVFSVSFPGNGSSAEEFNVSFSDDARLTMVDRSLKDGDGILIQGRTLKVCRRRTRSFVDKFTGKILGTALPVPAPESALVVPPQPPASSELGVFASSEKGQGGELSLGPNGSL
ncbi:MAG: vWA domain-containing protein [Pseudomonadota bacterium]|nr:vWA domain-containing protein [Pseudomonadota bacterium]